MTSSIVVWEESAMIEYDKYLEDSIKKIYPYLVEHGNQYFLDVDIEKILILDKREVSKDNDNLIVDDICDFVVEGLNKFLQSYNIIGFNAYNEYEGVFIL